MEKDQTWQRYASGEDEEGELIIPFRSPCGYEKRGEAYEKCRAEYCSCACGRLGVTGTGDAGHRKPLEAFLGDAHETRGFLGFDSTSVASIDVGGVRLRTRRTAVHWVHSGGADVGATE